MNIIKKLWEKYKMFCINRYRDYPLILVKFFKDCGMFILIVTLSSFFAYFLGSAFLTSNITNLLSAVLTGINVCVALKASSYTRQSAKYQRDSVIENKQIDQSSQAVKIYSHIIPSIVKSHAPTKRLREAIYKPVLLGNSSNEPIYKVFIISCSNKTNFRRLVKEYKIFSKHDYYSNHFLFNHYYVYLRIVMPGIIYRLIRTQGNAAGGERPAAMIFFTDSRGNKWVRDSQGNLQLLPKEFDVCHFCHIDATGMFIPSTFDNHNYKSLTKFYKKHEKLR